MSIYALANLIARLFNVYEFMIVVWCIMSWVPRGIGHGGIDTFRDALGTLVEPYLGFFRRLMPALGGVDFSPILAIFALCIIERVVLSIIL